MIQMMHRGKLLRACGKGISGRRNCNIGKSNKLQITKVPLSEPLDFLPKPVYASLSSIAKETVVTELSNGLKVASEPKFGKFCTVGVAIDSGSRYEVAYPSGISHFLEKLAFGDTQNMTREQIMSTFESLGGICDCQCSRDTFIYAASVENVGFEKAVEILGEVVLRPKISADEVRLAQMAVTFDLEDQKLQPEKDVLLMEMIHAAAYQGNTLGLPKICPFENISRLGRNTLFSYLSQHHTPKRMVLAGVGVNHDELVEAAERYFVKKPPIWKVEELDKRKIEVDTSVSQYTGGLAQEEADLSDISIGPNPLPELAHLVLGLESVGHQHKDFVAFCVLNMMMGGGGSFSAGGPGKGMYTRLYTNVLNRYHWMHNATAYNHSYADSGLFCIHASSHPSHLGDLTQVLTREFTAMTGRVDDQEFKRAKKQLQSMLLMNLESRPVIFEDMARQVLATGHRHQPEYFIDLIDKIKSEDLVRIATRLLKGKPSVAAYGTLKKLPSFNEIESGLQQRDGRLPSRSRFSIFR